MTRIIWLILLTAIPVNAADWLQFRGPTGGISPEKGLPVTWNDRENLAWKVELPGAGTSSPVFMGEHLYITCYSGYNVPGKPRGVQADLRLHLLCLNRKTGKTIWDQAIPAKLPEQETIRDGHGYASATPVLDRDRVYCFFGKTGVFAFDLNGKQLWQADVGSQLNGWGSAASPILYGKLLIVNASVESEALIALDVATGKEVWRVTGIKESWNTPVIVQSKEHDDELLIAIAGKILSINPKEGKTLWTCATDITWYMVPSIVEHDGIAYCIGGRSGVAALAVRTGGQGDVTKTHRLWTGKKGSNVSSPVFHDGHLYWMNDNSGMAYCANAKTGEVIYEQRLDRPGQVYASALLADGKIYYVSRDGRTFVIAAKPSYELLATNKFTDRSTFNSTPVAVDQRLFIRSDSALYCLEKK